MKTISELSVRPEPEDTTITVPCSHSDRRSGSHTFRRTFERTLGLEIDQALAIRHIGIIPLGAFFPTTVGK
jgi:hypothetical protein